MLTHGIKLIIVNVSRIPANIEIIINNNILFLALFAERNKSICKFIK